MENVILDIIDRLTNSNRLFLYLFFFFSQCLQIIFPPYPGDMVLVIEGYLSELLHLNIYFVLIIAWFGTFLSSLMLYKLGEKEKEKILQLKIIRVIFDTEKFIKIKEMFNKYGSAAIFISKFIPGIHSFTLLIAGIFEVNKKLAYLTIGIVNITHHALLIILGKILKENWAIIINMMKTYNKYIIIAIIVFGFFYLLSIRTNKKKFD
ncbi:membrane protein DedA, SNARE-associated domain [Caloranaerobacter azorensis DSM 13643]|uniref:Membrane protein DedA, SNARE-associated domain n=1 Tax=Caloranaerobacter azorensis DSM 13643 TaxID=1121264 RepID=A0A1M5VVB2_9FIRM|nr:DedA family protein [Caloranaerobacter azorensis]SHH79186.1 membrane protein DedA, SNARE-associated domain [Caloranaerobacter azorensis DSM 13643]